MDCHNVDEHPIMENMESDCCISQGHYSCYCAAIVMIRNLCSGGANNSNLIVVPILTPLFWYPSKSLQLVPHVQWMWSCCWLQFLLLLEFKTLHIFPEKITCHWNKMIINLALVNISGKSFQFKALCSLNFVSEKHICCIVMLFSGFWGYVCRESSNFNFEYFGRRQTWKHVVWLKVFGRFCGNV